MQTDGIYNLQFAAGPETRLIRVDEGKRDNTHPAFTFTFAFLSAGENLPIGISLDRPDGRLSKPSDRSAKKVSSEVNGSLSSNPHVTLSLNIVDKNGHASVLSVACDHEMIAT